MAAVTTDAQVCNQALGYVGQRLTIGSLLEDSTEAIACRVHYQTTKQAVLEARWWTWATKRLSLAQLTGVTRLGYEYVHAAPSDLVSANGARYIETGGRPEAQAGQIPFLVELNDSGNAFVIASDVETPKLVYTRDVPVALWPAKAIDALAWALAVKLSLTLPVKPALAVSLEGKATKALLEAQAADMNAPREDAVPDAEWVQARGTTVT